MIPRARLLPLAFVALPAVAFAQAVGIDPAVAPPLSPHALAVLASVLGAIVVADHLLASIPPALFPPNSTGQLLLRWLKWILDSLLRIAGRGPAAVLLLAALSLPACKASPEVIAIDASIATVQTVNEGVHLYAQLAPGIDSKLASSAISQCVAKPTHAARKACQDAAYALARKPYALADRAIALYRGVLAAGSAASQDDIASAAAAVISALSAVGIHITGGTGGVS